MEDILEFLTKALLRPISQGFRLRLILLMQIWPVGTVNGEVFRLEVDTKSLAMIEKDRKVIWVTVSVEESDIYKMDERDLVTHMEISPALAVLGGETGRNCIRVLVEKNNLII